MRGECRGDFHGDNAVSIERINQPMWMLMLLLTATANAVPPGDTQGVGSAVRLRPAVGGAHSFEVWFSSTSHDRWGCIQADGYIVVNEAAAGMTVDNYKRIFAIALAAQAAGK